MLEGKHIIVGITGSIAAYKAAYLVRSLVKQGAEVKVIMTEKAKEFITPLTMATLSKNPILIDFFDPTNGNWNSHVDLGLWADAYLIAPITANTLAKMANGMADNLLSTTYLSCKCPVLVAPAMDLDMYAHPATQKNIHLLQDLGVKFIEAQSGELASGLTGKGRMEEPEQIVQQVSDFFSTEKNNDLLKKKILITAGPTQEKIDPVRYIGNQSSGKMAYALAEECAERGAEVTLISGPVLVKVQHPSITCIPVISAEEMYTATLDRFEQTDVAILCAAVADFTPKNTSLKKIKRKKDNLVIELTPTKDIAATLGQKKTTKQLLVGFALETDNETTNAKGKLERKNLDLIVLNSMNDKNAGFGYDTNKVSIINRLGRQQDFKLKSKKEVAKDIVNEISAWEIG